MREIENVEAEPTEQMITGKNAHEQLYEEFLNTAKPSSIKQIIKKSRKSDLLSRELFVESETFGIPGQNLQYAFLEYRSLDDETLHRIIELLMILGTLFLLDIVTTQIILRMGGVELNPVMAGIVVNPVLHLGIKASILLIIFSVSLIAEQRVKGSCSGFYCVLIAIYIFVVVNNLFVILPALPV